MNPKQERDEWLMAQLALGKRDHLEPLIRRYANPLLTFIQRMIGDRHRSEELFQEVFLAVWVKRRQYQFPRPFTPRSVIVYLRALPPGKPGLALRYQLRATMPVKLTVPPARVYEYYDPDKHGSSPATRITVTQRS